ncbi:hypothetical protein L6V77_33085 [Myxococcota bacterium]|nr:hypothetical protein [Myxococcota bacterium]
MKHALPVPALARRSALVAFAAGVLWSGAALALYVYNPPPKPVGRYYAAAKGGYSAASEMKVTIKKEPGQYTTTDLSVVVRRMDGTLVKGIKFAKANSEVSFEIPANSMRCTVDNRGDKLCQDNVTVCGGGITQKNHYEIAVYTADKVKDPVLNAPALAATPSRVGDPKLRMTKGIGIRGFNPFTNEYPLTKNAPYMPPPVNVSDGMTCRPGPEPWPEPEPSFDSTAL